MKPTAMVINTDNHKKSGAHWLAIYVDKSNNGFYFDSFGFAPFIPEHIQRLRKNCKRYRWNEKQLQSISSDVCGQFCLMFLKYMSEGMGYNAFLRNFSDDLKKNDEIARKFVMCEKSNVSNFIGNGIYNIKCLQNCCSKMSLM